MVRASFAWLVLASLFFYGWWNPVYLWILLLSMLSNYSLGRFIAGTPPRQSGLLFLIAGVVLNLSLLGYFKYSGFIVMNVNALSGSDWAIAAIVLPLGISFFTFQQIAYLADCHRYRRAEADLVKYSLFVSFFPQLIAGPIVHHREMIHQFDTGALKPFSAEMFGAGVAVFAIGLFKKVVIADGVAGYATPVFQAAETGAIITAGAAWQATLAYSLQIYFDFSGYSDMAIGLGLTFGIRLPVNFNSPYKAVNITDFWRRWHMTLSRFLRDYLYFPLGGSRKGQFGRYGNLMIVMLLGGLWHGAGWTFVLWGGLHGLYLVVNHFWRWLGRQLGLPDMSANLAGRTTGRLITLCAVMLAWIPFRAESFDGALRMYGALVTWGSEGTVAWSGLAIVICGILLIYCVHAPNSQELVVGRTGREAGDAMTSLVPFVQGSWRPSVRLAAATGMLLLISALNLANPSEFLYFQF